MKAANPPDRFKVTPPSLDGTVPRRMLLERLAAMTTPGKWLCAPSGSGKSTLVAAYALGRKRPVVWYRLDERDDDPGFFFPEITAALAQARTVSGTLPSFSAFDQGSEVQFASRFFKAALGRTASTTLLVFDDCQSASAEWLFGAYSQLLKQVPAAIEVVFISAAPPPPQLFDAIVARRLSLANDLELSFSADECSAIAQLQRLSGMSGEDIVALTGGHAGAVVLACEFLRGARPVRAPQDAVAQQLHAHLLGKLVDQLPTDLRDVLLRASSLPRLTAVLVNDLLGRDDATAQLEALAERGLLIRYAFNDDVLYEAHGLVRAGAQTLARMTLGESGARAQRERCADLLQANGMLEDAFTLWVELERADRALAALEPLAERYARQQQPRLLQRAMARVPAQLARARPWLCFWAGQGVLALDEALARQWFEHSFVAFEAAHDEVGMSLAAASVLIAFNSELGDLHTLDAWLARFRAHKTSALAATAMPWRALFLLGLLCEVNMSDANDAAAEDVASAKDELLRLLDQPEAWPSNDQRLEAAHIVLEHAFAFHTAEQARQIAMATEPLATDPNNSPLLRGRWWIEAAELFNAEGAAERAEECLRQVDALIEDSDSRRLRFELARVRVTASMRSGNVEAAAAALPTLERLTVGGTRTELAVFSRLATRVLLLQRRPREALERAEASLEAAAQAGYSRAHARVFEVEYAYALAANGHYVQAAQRMHELAGLQSGTQRDLVASIAHCLDFLAAPQMGTASLARGLELARKASFHTLFMRVPDLLAELCDTALSNDIDASFVRELIVTQALKPPPNASRFWPWPVRVWTLGGFRLEINDEPYRPPHKSQDKPLELLKTLVAGQATGRTALDKTTLAEQLWPDSDAADARKSLDMTIARLRRLLESDAALDVAEGKLRLAPDRVWTDVRTLVESLARLRSLHGGQVTGRVTTTEALQSALIHVLDSYTGAFLQGEDETPWLLGARGHLSAEFRSALVACEPQLGRADSRSLIVAVERALASEPIAEDLARLLMRAYARRGEYAEALRVYRRSRELLSIVLGVSPSAQTEELRKQIYAAAQTGATTQTG